MRYFLIQEVADSSSEEDESIDDLEDYFVNISDGYVRMIEIIRKNPRVAVKNYVEEVVLLYDDIDFITHFRLNRNLVKNLTSMYEDSPMYSSLGSHGGPPVINAYKQILVFLWYIGHETGGFAEMREKFDLAYRTLFNIIDRVSQFVCTLGPEVIKYPKEEEKLATSSFFYELNNFPGIIGIIDGTHIKIDKPAEDPDSYVNRKKFFSLHLQGVVNHKRKFIDVFCGYPGSVHDARVLRCSPFYDDLPNLCNGENSRYILGDSAYPCLNCLIVPFKDNGHLTNAQRRFNTRLSQCRIAVEHALGILKQRFRKMYHLNIRKRERQLRLIYACCILHNLADEEELQYLEPPLPDDVQFEEDPAINANLNIIEDNILNEFLHNGSELRNLICTNISQI